MSKEYREPRKKSFQLYYDNELDALDELSDEELGLYYRAIVMHEVYGQETETKDRTVRALTKATIRAMDRDLSTYQATCERNKQNRNKRSCNDQSSPVVTNGTNTETDTDTDTETDTDTQIDTKKEKDMETGTVSLKGSCSNSTYEEQCGILAGQVKKIYTESPDTYYDMGTIQNILISYLDSYQSAVGEPHVPIATNKLEEIIQKLHVIYGEHEEELFNISNYGPTEALEIYQTLIGKHFSTDYEACDYSIHHFISGEIRKNRYYEELC